MRASCSFLACFCVNQDLQVTIFSLLYNDGLRGLSCCDPPRHRRGRGVTACSWLSLRWLRSRLNRSHISSYLRTRPQWTPSGLRAAGVKVNRRLFMWGGDGSGSGASAWGGLVISKGTNCTSRRRAVKLLLWPVAVTGGAVAEYVCEPAVFLRWGTR